MAKIKVSFIADDGYFSQEDLMKFLQEQEGVSGVKFELLEDGVGTKPEVAVGPISE